MEQGPNAVEWGMNSHWMTFSAPTIGHFKSCFDAPHAEATTQRGLFRALYWSLSNIVAPKRTKRNRL